MTLPALVACQHRGIRSRSSSTPGTQAIAPAQWSQARRDEPSTLPARLLSPELSADIALTQLDLALDLFDAARFGPDPDAAAALWKILALEGSAHGSTPTREALTALLDRAYRIEAAYAGRFDADAESFLSSVIMLLNVDVNHPGDADQLEVQLLAHRSLIESGHPRVADNARWRLYDHVRDALNAAAGRDGERGVEIGVHALLVQHESLSPWLRDGGPHARALPPTAGSLIALAEAQIAALRALEHWGDLPDRRWQGDQSMYARFLARWPDAPVAGLPKLETGAGRPESALPRLRLSGKGMRWGAADSALHPFGFDQGQSTQELETYVRADGRLGLFVDAPASLPAPDLAAALRASVRAGVQTLEFGIAEARHRGGENPPQLSEEVWTQLPLRIVRTEDHGPEAEALRESRVAMELSGRGAWLWADDQLVNAEALDGRALEEMLASLVLAYPNNAGLRMYLHDDLSYEQLITAMSAALGRADATPGTHFRALGWTPQEPRPDRSTTDPKQGQALLASRLALAGRTWRLEVIQPFAMRPDDQGRAESMANKARVCWTELGLQPEDLNKLAAIEFTISLDEGGVAEHDYAFRYKAGKRGPRIDARFDAATHTCLKSETQRLRLPSHRDKFDMTFRYHLEEPRSRGGE